jgi:hypothetical protein
VKDTRFCYLFASYDSPANPNVLSLFRLNIPVKKDNDLRERKKGNIEDYVANLYS